MGDGQVSKIVFESRELGNRWGRLIKTWKEGVKKAEEVRGIRLGGDEEIEEPLTQFS